MCGLVSSTAVQARRSDGATRLLSQMRCWQRSERSAWRLNCAARAHPTAPALSLAPQVISGIAEHLLTVGLDQRRNCWNTQNRPADCLVRYDQTLAPRFSRDQALLNQLIQHMGAYLGQFRPVRRLAGDLLNLIKHSAERRLILLAADRLAIHARKIRDLAKKTVKSLDTDQSQTWHDK